MATERGQRITLTFGGVAADVMLVKTSRKPREAKHETRRVEVAPAPDLAAQLTAGLPEDRAAVDMGPVADALDVDEVLSEVEAKSVEHADALTGDMPPAWDAGLGASDFEDEVVRAMPETRVEQGVTLDDGSWLDLTDELAAIDERCILDGMDVVATIPSASVPRERVRDAHFVNVDDPSASKVLALLWRGLCASQRVAVVRWTKRTNQALGVIVPRGVRSGHGAAGKTAAHLVLLELEWSANMAAVPAKATGPITVAVSEREQAAAEKLVEAFAEAPAFLDTVQDERTAKRAELLTKAREGQLDGYEAPPEVEALPDNVVDLADAFASAAGR